MTITPHEIVWTSEKAKRIWDYYASNPAYHDQYFGSLFGTAVAELLLRTVTLPDEARLLDLSCGRGDLIAAVFPRLGSHQRIVGTDMSHESVETCRARFEGWTPQIEIELVGGFPTSLAAGHFDVVLATEVIEHLKPDEIESFLAESKRLLRPGGTILITTPNAENYDASKVLCPDCGCVFHRWQHQRSWTRDELKSQLESSGFTTTLATPVNWNELLPNPGWKDRLKRLLRPFRAKPAQGGLVYVGTRGS